MYPNLYYLFYDLFGLKIELLKIVQSFGFFVALAFIGASYTLSSEIHRKTQQGFFKPTYKTEKQNGKASILEILVNSFYGFILGFKLPLFFTNFEYVVNNPQETLISTSGNLVIGIITSLSFLLYSLKKAKNHKNSSDSKKQVEIEPQQHVGNIIMLGAVSGILGAKIFHLMENPDEIAGFFNGTNSFFSGLTMYGGLIFAAFTIILYGQKNNLKPKHLIDAAAPSVMLGYAIGRIGCHISGDGDWGVANTLSKPNWLNFLPDWMWAYNYPNNVIGVFGPQLGNSSGIEITNGPCWTGYCTELYPAVFPTAFYEAIICLILFGILWQIRKRISIPGILFSIYLMFNGLERFLIEKIRVNEKVFGLDITQAEIISSFLFALGLFGLFYFKKIHNNAEHES